MVSMSPGSDINLESPENLFISRQAQIGQLYFELGGFIDFLQRQMIVSDSDTDILNTVLLDSTNSQPDLDLSTCTEEDFLSLYLRVEKVNISRNWEKNSRCMLILLYNKAFEKS